ncbi:hypothetical protein SAMN05421690_1004115 [Nitrosomonas sp. Nm51]|uniref:hypothetical protein n=1 Tax=Nitrosomonas sp. Nm51 TaxID=133720 RepID=UPI0008D7DAF7|nr:hypothetical protein [Nitrosomonas sp. Nm51]SEQ96985.1 hypothetical protein SAMN05421690_1004115 [Nitrosomonas sp. Nm51]
MQKQNTKQPVVKRSNWPKFVTLALILTIVLFAVSLLPRGFSGDTSLVGKGTRVLLLVHDDNILQSGETMAVMNEIRDEYAERLTFIVADINIPEGKTFADRHGLMPTALVFFSASGSRLQTLYTPQTAESLRLELNKLFQY